ncbi:MAG: hypothetical protein PHQ93_00120 [Sulfurimonas sp.]|uniref:hypothetical protein n=1 Tax=Sulfurimonas sp. TaxID=2022749 RepID=UPI002634B413|nr:hypothetical protein [Sulfurimonas sp.]MDD5399580.1 hypothetical protein [Sulfurimonas sp.]
MEKNSKDPSIFDSLLRKFKCELPNNLKTKKIYEEIQNFKDAEYIYCIAYEMLIRTYEYNNLLKEYDIFLDESSKEITNEELVRLNKLIDSMNKLGLKKTSFLGFDCEDDFDNVFKKIKYYDEIRSSSWSVRLLHKFKLDHKLGFKSIFHLVIDFYYKREKLYFLTDNNDCEIIKNVNISEFLDANDSVTLNQHLYLFYIPCTLTGDVQYKSLSDDIYLNELDKDFVSILEEKKKQDLLISVKSEYSKHNFDFWYKYSINDIKDGFDRLVNYHIHTKHIYNQDSEHMDVAVEKVFNNPSEFYIPCVNRINEPVHNSWEKGNSKISKNDFTLKLEQDGYKCVFGAKGYVTTHKIENIYLIKLQKDIPLIILDSEFLETLEYEDLKNNYINTEPLFSRPRLMFDEARLVNIPINLNLSKEDLLLYVAQIKNDYDKNKNIVKNDVEYFFDLSLESDRSKLPENVKHPEEKKDTKKLLPNGRLPFKKAMARAFYIYDLYKFLIPIIEKERKEIKDSEKSKIAIVKEKHTFTRDPSGRRDEIRYIKQNTKGRLDNNDIYTVIGNVLEDLSREQIIYYLDAMKEFIHGVNMKDENNVLKKEYTGNKDEKYTPKYKDLIIGNSYLLKSKIPDLMRSLFN